MNETSVTMNEAQTIFTLFYALYFAATTTLTGKFQPFDTPAMYKLQWRAWVRFFVSFGLLNVAPLGYFVWVFQWLESINNFSKDYKSMLVLLILGLAGFGFYRLYFGIMLLHRKQKPLFFETSLPKQVEEELDQRHASHRDAWAHIIPGLIWIGLTLALGWFWISGKI